MAGGGYRPEWPCSARVCVGTLLCSFNLLWLLFCSSSVSLPALRRGQINNLRSIFDARRFLSFLPPAPQPRLTLPCSLHRIPSRSGMVHGEAPPRSALFGPGQCRGRRCLPILHSKSPSPQTQLEHHCDAACPRWNSMEPQAYSVPSPFRFRTSQNKVHLFPSVISEPPSSRRLRGVPLAGAPHVDRRLTCCRSMAARCALLFLLFLVTINFLFLATSRHTSWALLQHPQDPRHPPPSPPLLITIPVSIRKLSHSRFRDVTAVPSRLLSRCLPRVMQISP